MLLGLAPVIVGVTVRCTRMCCRQSAVAGSILDEDTLIHLLYEHIMVKDLLSAKEYEGGECYFCVCVLGEGRC